eukprot:2922979-Prymnesium_polylepis.1
MYVSQHISVCHVPSVAGNVPVVRPQAVPACLPSRPDVAHTSDGKAVQAIMAPKARKSSAAEAPESKRAKASTDANDEPAAYVPTWADDDEAPFPRGGGVGTALSPLEYQAIARAAKRDAADEQEAPDAGERADKADEVSGEAAAGSVSYTHLTLPTICSV